MSRRGLPSFYTKKDKKNDHIISGLLSSHLRTRQEEQRPLPSAPPLPPPPPSRQSRKSPPRKSPRKTPPITRTKSKSIPPVDYTEHDDDDVIELPGAPTPTPTTPTAPIKKRKTTQGVEKKYTDNDGNFRNSLKYLILFNIYLNFYS
jgi:hypothetical protein